MMNFDYFRPGTRVRDLVGSYYCLEVPEGFADVMRAEIANIRIVLQGAAYTSVNTGEEERYPAGSVILCGPTFRWSGVRFESGTQVFGAAITPFGWGRIFDLPANEMADQFRPLEDIIGAQYSEAIDAVLAAPDAAARVAATDALFMQLDQSDKKVNTDFLERMTAWLTDPEPNELEDLLAAIDLSPRQVERLSKLYFGSAPKKLHRKFRALHSANRLTWQDLTDWRDVATTAYFDQSHFIREFKQFNGRTPSEFIKGAHLLVRQTLQERRKIEHHSPYSLVG